MEPLWMTRLLSSSLSCRSRACYVLALEYASAWHQLRYDGAPLPLADFPARPMNANGYLTFVKDHLPLIRDGRIECSMQPRVMKALQALGFNQRRPCPSEATTLWRLSILKACHGCAGLQPSSAFFRRGDNIVREEWQRVRVAMVAQQCISSSHDLMLRLRGACEDTRDGRRKAALVTLLQILTPAQLARLRFGDLNPVTFSSGGETFETVTVHIREPASRFQRLFSTQRLTGEDADAVTFWGGIRVWADVDAGVATAPPDLPFLVWDDGVNSYNVTARWILNEFKQLLSQAGLNSPGVRFLPSTLRLTYERECSENRRLLSIAGSLGVRSRESTFDVLRTLID